MAKDLNLADTTVDTPNNSYAIANKRDIVIQFVDSKKRYTIDFTGYSFIMNSSDYGVTFKNLNLYGRSYFGMVENAGSYTFDNIDYTGSQLVYTEPAYSTTVTFKGNVNSTSVASYVGPLDNKSRTTQGSNGNQQVLQFRAGTNNIVFETGSTVHLKTVNSNVIEIDGGSTTIDVQSGANVTLEPHTTTGPESNFMGVNGISRGIASKGTTTLNIEKNATLKIPLTMATGDKYLSSAMDLESGATIDNRGNLEITSDGTPYYQANGWDDPVYINGNAQINVDNGATFSLESTNLGDFKGHLMTVSGNAAVNLAPHSTFKITGDGTGAVTAINLSSGSTFTSDQPKEFTIDLSKNTSTGKALIKNGTINFKRVKNMDVDQTSQVPLGEATVKYTNTGTLSSMKLTGEGRPAKTALRIIHNYIHNNSNKLSFVAAGEDVTLTDVHLSKDNKLTGIALSSGDSTNPIHIVVKINGETVGLPSDNTYQMYSLTGDSLGRSSVKDNGSLKNNGGKFTIDLSSVADKLTPGAKISVVATKDFVNSPIVEKTIEDLRAVDTTNLQDLVSAADTEKGKATYYNATAEAQKAYDDAITAGQTILDNIKNNTQSYDQTDIDAAVKAISDAMGNLKGEATSKTDLQNAVDAADTTKASGNYTNADLEKQQAYDTAIAAGKTVLNDANATQKQVNDALDAINTAKAGLNGDAKEAADNKDALQKAIDDAPNVQKTHAYYNGDANAKTTYDNAIKSGEKVLADKDATPTQIKKALDTINTAKDNLKGQETNKDALQQAINASGTTKTSENYTNADSDKQ